VDLYSAFIVVLANSHIMCDPTIQQPGFDLSRQQSPLLNRFSHETGTLRCLQKEMVTYVTFRDLTLLDIANLCPAVLIMNFLFV